jgi:hypothetical protein
MAKPRSSMVKSNIYIDPKVQKGLRYLADKRGTSYSQLVREAMRKFLIDALREEKDHAEVLSEPAAERQ